MDQRTKLDLGSGFVRQGDDWIHIDISKECKPDYVWDIAKTPYPKEWAAKNKFDYIRAENILEHFEWDARLKMIKEFHRILKPGGILWIRVPDASASLEAALRDPTHKFPPFVPTSFDYFDSYSARWQNYGKLYGIPEFEKIKQTQFIGKNPQNVFIDCELIKI